MKIKGRDVLFFFLGIVAILIIDTAMNWNETKQLVKESASDELKKIEAEK